MLWPIKFTGKEKFGITEPLVVLEEDGSQIDDDVFSLLPKNTILLILNEGEQWEPANSIASAPATVATKPIADTPNPSTGDITSQARIRRDSQGNIILGKPNAEVC